MEVVQRYVVLAPNDPTSGNLQELVEVGGSCKEEWIKRSLIWNIRKRITRNSVEMRRRFRCLTAFELMTPLSNLISLLHRHFQGWFWWSRPKPKP